MLANWFPQCVLHVTCVDLRILAFAEPQRVEIFVTAHTREVYQILIMDSVSSDVVSPRAAAASSSARALSRSLKPSSIGSHWLWFRVIIRTTTTPVFEAAIDKICAILRTAWPSTPPEGPAENPPDPLAGPVGHP